MANILKKVMEPILKQERIEAYKRGHEHGMRGGFEEKVQSYENEIECLKTIQEQLRKELEKSNNEKEFFANELMRIQSTDDMEYRQKVIRIDYLDLRDNETAMKVLTCHLARFAQSFDRRR